MTDFYRDAKGHPYQVDSALVLSTAHLTRKTSERIERDHPDMPSAALMPDYGYFVWVDADWTSDACPELVNVMRFAAARGCQWIRFDCDGPEVAELPLFTETWAIKLCCKCEGPITTPLLPCEDERCVHCADYSEDDPDAAELDDSHLFDERQAFVDAQNAARDTEEV